MSWLGILLSLTVIVAGFWVGGLMKSPWEPFWRVRLRRSAGLAIAGLGVWLSISVLLYEPAGPKLECLDDVEHAISEGQARQLPVFLEFTADWCAACHELERRALNTSQVIERSAEFVCAKVDVTNQDDPRVEELSRRYGVIGGPPAIVFLDQDGEAMEQYTIREVVDWEGFLSRFEAARAGSAGSAGGFPSPFEQARHELGFLLTLAMVFLAGVLTSLTPCVYPLIPITISIFGARKAKTKLQGLSLSSVYVAGIVITYVVLGIIAAAVGGVVGRAFQSPVVMVAIASLFIVLGFSSVGLFEIKLPGRLQERLSTKGGSGYLSALFMGLIAGVIAAPCVGPWLAGILIFIAETGDLLSGAVYMAAFALGMGQLFLLLGTFTSLIARMPRSGAWLDRTKTAFGTVFAVVGLTFLAMTFPALSSFANWVATL